MFAQGATTGVEVASDPLVAVGDGLDFLKNQDQFYVNPVITSKLLRPVTKGMGWTMEGNRQRDTKNPDAGKGPFRLFAVSDSEIGRYRR